MKALLTLILLAPIACFASLEELIGTELVDAKGQPVELSSLEGKVIGLYFSAEWCPPCRAFTPSLVKLRDRRSDEFEVVFISSDRSAEDQQGYMKNYKMRWPSLPFGSPKRSELSSKFNISGIPALVIVDSDGNLISRNGRGDMGRSDTDARKALRTWQRSAGVADTGDDN
jgi:nucleoredoxin